MSTTAAAVLAKLAGLGTAGKTALGLVVATGVVGVAAAVPAIADPSNDPVAPVPSASSSAQPTDEPTEGTPSAEPTETPDDSPTAEATEAPRPSPSDLPSAAAFGQSVAADARDGGVDGQEISREAHARNAAREAGHDAAEPTESPEPTEAPEPARTLPAVMPTGEPGPGAHPGDWTGSTRP